MSSIKLKVGNMKKDAQFSIYPYQGNGSVLVQSDRRIARINLASGEGVINSKVGTHPASHLLLPQFNPITFQCPAVVLEQIKDYLRNNSGRQSLGGVISYTNAVYTG